MKEGEEMGFRLVIVRIGQSGDSSQIELGTISDLEGNGVLYISDLENCDVEVKESFC